MKTVERVSELQKVIAQARADGNSVGFVPTMGYLHKGHIALIKKARQETDFLVVSIYVNPTQFGAGEDYKEYPRDLDRDLDVCRENQVDLVFTPQDSEVYPEGFQTTVSVKELSQGLCGDYRKGHFDGVATVVAKLFNMVEPNKAYFGLKDYQQFKVIERLVKDLNFNIEIIGVPTVRDADGLATSSRNSYLDYDERTEATVIYKSLCKAERLLKDGLRNCEQIKKALTQSFIGKDLIKIQYLEIVDCETLKPVANIEGEALIAIAAIVGRTRLIDNLLISETGESQCSAPC